MSNFKASNAQNGVIAGLGISLTDMPYHLYTSYNMKNVSSFLPFIRARIAVEIWTATDRDRDDRDRDRDDCRGRGHRGRRGQN